MKLTELLRTECIRVGSTVDDKAMALCEIAALAKKSAILKNVSEEAILEAMQERETLGTTAFGHGIAIPHCRMKGIRDFVVGLLTVPEGVEFESEDAQKVHLLVFIISPPKSDNAHIRLLSTVSQALQDASVVRAMIEAPDSKTLRSLFLEATKEDVSEQLPLSRSMVHIFVQDESAFLEILEALSSLEDTSLNVFDGQSCSSSLVAAQSGTGSSVKGNGAVSKCITAIIDRSLSNEVIRRVETITGSLQECIGVMVTVQELTYSGGSLGF
ncbi:MAG: PTS sugar transporter subunit IIA [Planctomycetota bacterium]|jgi:PTS system nitrogen regulatory IIA component